MEKAFTINPILIPRVINSILDNLNISEVEKMRCVNTQWNEEACKILRITKTIVFNGVADVSFYIVRFSAFKNSALHYPHSSFTFFSCVLRELQRDTRYQSLLNTFFDRCGHYVKSLHLSLEDFYFGGKDLKQLIIENKLPNLETLSLIFSGTFDKDVSLSEDIETELKLPKLKKLCVNIIGYDIVQNVEFVIGDILVAALNLEKISYRVYGIDCESFTRYSSVTLAKILTQSILTVPSIALRKLKSLEYLIPLNDDQLQALTTKSIPLELCFLDLEPTVELPTLQKFYLTFSKTMKKLHLDVTSSKYSCKFFQFPCLMINLNFLSLTAFEGSLNFEMLPVLTTLIVISVNVDKLLKTSRMHMSLTSIQLLNCWCLTALIVEKISQWFPNLKKFHFNDANNDIVRSVYEYLPLLEDLSVIGEEVTDAGICGIMDKICTQIIEIGNLTEMRLTSDSLRQFPFIGDLHNLKYLRLDSTLVTDAAVLLGIKRCIGLRKLHMFNSLRLTNISFEVIVNLKNLTSAGVLVQNYGLLDLTRMRRLFGDSNSLRFQ